MAILTQQSLVAIDNNGAAASFRVQGSIFAAVTRTGVGVVQGDTVPTRGYADPSSVAFYPRGPLAPSGLRSVTFTPNSETQADFWCQEEGAGGAASAPADFDFNFISTAPGGRLARLVAMGRITGGRVPEWAWSAGRIDQGAGFVPGPAGNYTFALVPTQGTTTTSAIVVAQPALPQSGSDMRVVGAEDVSDVQKRLTLLREGGGGGPSDFADYDVDVGIFELGAGPGCGRPYASCFYAPGAPLDPAGNSGAFDAAVIVHGVGDIELSFVTTQGIGPDESIVLFGVPVIPGPLGLLHSIGYTRPSPDSIRITTAVEGPAGAASVLADYPFQISIFRVADVLY